MKDFVASLKAILDILEKKNYPLFFFLTFVASGFVLLNFGGVDEFLHFPEKAKLWPGVLCLVSFVLVFFWSLGKVLSFLSRGFLTLWSDYQVIAYTKRLSPEEKFLLGIFVPSTTIPSSKHVDFNHPLVRKLIKGKIIIPTDHMFGRGYISLNHLARKHGAMIGVEAVSTHDLNSFFLGNMVFELRGLPAERVS